MEQITYYIGLTFFSVIVGLLGVFYRNILRIPEMVLNPLYLVFRNKMVKRGGFLKFIAYPLGFCIFCNTTWIAILGFLIIYQTLSFDVLVPIAISHWMVIYFCKHYANLPDFNGKPKKRKEADKVAHTPSELLMKVINKTGATIKVGSIVYIDTIYKGIPSIRKADAMLAENLEGTFAVDRDILPSAAAPKNPVKDTEFDDVIKH